VKKTIEAALSNATRKSLKYHYRLIFHSRMQLRTSSVASNKLPNDQTLFQRAIKLTHMYDRPAGAW